MYYLVNLLITFSMLYSA